MCRALPDEPRRCPCDTSAARAGRRRAAKLREGYTDKVVPRTPPRELPESKTPPAPVQPELTRVESLTAEAQNILANIDFTKDSTPEIVKLGEAVDEIAQELGDYDEEAFIEFTQEIEGIREQIALDRKAKNDAWLHGGGEAAHFEAIQNSPLAPRENGEPVANYRLPHLIRDLRGEDPAVDAYFAARDFLNIQIASSYKRSDDLHSEIVEAQRSFIARRNAAYQEALKTVGVQFADPESLKLSGATSKPVISEMKKAVTYFPQEWVDGSNANESALTVKKTQSRAMYHHRKIVTSYKTEDRSVVELEHKSSSWEPDPQSRTDLEYTRVETGGDWVDPRAESGYKRHIFPPHHPDSTTWIRQHYDYSDTPQKGYESIQVKKETFTSGEGYSQTDEIVTVYRKPKTERTKYKKYERGSQMTISSGNPGYTEGYTRVAIHEFSHRLEHSNPHIAKMEQHFMEHRTGANTDTPERMSYIRRGEKGYRDNFPTHYMGRIYDGHAFELLSMGMESVFSGTQGGFIGTDGFKADPEYKNFILGMLASSVNKRAA